MENSLQQYEGSEYETEYGGGEHLEPEIAPGDFNPATCEDPTSPDFLVGKPQVWVRMRPTACCDNNIFDIAEDNKTMRITVEPEDRIMQKKSGKTSIFQYCADGILRDSSQKDTHKALVRELVQKALDGICGAVLCVGPEFSGKSYSMFGSLDKFQERGIVFRAIEELFEEVEAMKNEKEYHIVLSMFEVRKDKIKDLITLGDYELKQVGEFGPKGLFYEEIFNMEQAIVLILRGLFGQKLFPREPWAKPHTIIYVDVICRHVNHGIGITRDWRSRLTFVENAPLPQRERPKNVYNAVKTQPAGQGRSQFNGWCPGGDPNLYPVDDYGQPIPVKKQIELPVKEEKDILGGKGNFCGCGKGGPPGPLAESISIRKDFSFLEQMFVRAHDLRKIATYYAKLKSLGMYMLHQPPKLAPSQYFRQSRLAHCLKDIVTGKTEVRVVLHIRPEREFIQSTLESMRFAERARCIPCESKPSDADDDKNFEQQIATMCKELGIEDTSQMKGFAGVNSIGVAQMFPHIDGEKMKTIMAQATTHFEEKLNTLEGSCKEQVKNMFETFRDIWMRLLDNTAQQASLPTPEVTAPESSNLDGTQTDTQLVQDKKGSVMEASLGTKEATNKKKGQKEKGKDKKDKGKKRRSSVKLNKSRSKGDKKTDAENTTGVDDLNSNTEDSTGAVAAVHGEGAAPEGDVAKKSETKEDQQNTKELSDGDGEKSAKKVGSSSSVHDIPKSRRKSSQASRGGKGKNKHTNSPVRQSVTEPADLHHDSRHSENHRKSAPAEILHAHKHHDDPEALEVHPETPLEEIVGEVEEVRTHTVEVTADIAFKHEAWQGFTATEAGGKLLAEFADLQTELRQNLLRHSEIQNGIGEITVKLTSNHVELDIMEQERCFAGVGVGVTKSGSQLVPSTREEAIKADNQTLETTRNELIAQLNEVRHQLQTSKQVVEDKKKQCEVVFYEHFMEKYHRFPRITSLPLSTLHQVATASALGALGFSMPASEEETNKSAADIDLRRSVLEQLMADKFEDLKRMAKQQAKEIVSFYPKRPAWSNV